jgi:hypothetical protein
VLAVKLQYPIGRGAYYCHVPISDEKFVASTTYRRAGDLGRRFRRDSEPDPRQVRRDGGDHPGLQPAGNRGKFPYGVVITVSDGNAPS